MYETCFVGTWSEVARGWEDVSLVRFTTCPWQPFCLKLMLEKMCRVATFHALPPTHTV